MSKFGITMIVFALLLGACAPSVQNPPTATATVVPSPTIVETPTLKAGMINVDGLSIPDPKVSNPELLDTSVSISPIVRFVKAMNTVGIEVTTQQVLDALNDPANYESRTDTNGNPYVQFAYTITATDLSYSTGFLYDEQAGWRPFTLRDLGAKRNLSFGTSSSGWLNEDTTEFMLAIEQVDSIVPWPKWVQLEPEPDTFDFSALEQEIERWHAENKIVQNVPLVIASGDWSLPDWLKDGSVSKDELARILQEYITTVVTHGKERGITQWIVVSEPYLPVDRENDLFYKIFGGYDYIDLAFESARKADPQATLIYNDIDNYDSGGVTSSLTREIVARLSSKGLIDAVGIQAHLGDWAGVPDFDDVTTTLQGYGLPVVVTEFDYNLMGVSGPKNERETQKASVYYNFLSAALEAGVTDFTFSGLDERTSGLEKGMGQKDADPTMFNMWVDPQPAYYATMNLLAQPKIIEPPAVVAPIIEMDGVQVPDPTISNPELFDLANPDSPIIKFANAFGVTPDEVGDLTPKALTRADGTQFVALTTHDLETTPTFDESGTPLLLAQQGANGAWVWKEATPADLYTLNGQVLEVNARTHRKDTRGTDDPSDDVWIFLYDNPDYKKLILQSGNRLIVGGEIATIWIFSNLTKADWDRIISDWDEIEQQLDDRQIPHGFVYDWETAEQVIKFAKSNGMDVRANPLPFDADVPSEFFDPSYSKEDIEKLLEFVTKSKVIKFGNDVGTWTLPAEMVARQIYLPGFGTGQQLDPVETVEMVARFIKEVDPKARLAYDESGVFENFPSQDFHLRYFEFIDKLLEAGVPIDILIEQGNYWVRSPLVEEKFKLVTEEARKRNLSFEGGEVNVNLSSIYSSWPNRPAERTVESADLLLVQAQMFADLVRFHNDYGIHGFGLGSLEDENCWQVDLGDLNADTTLSPNFSGERKPAWFAFMAAALKNFE